MDAHDDLSTVMGTASTPDLAAVRRVYDRMASEGALAGVDELLAICHDDVEMRTYVGTGPGSFGSGRHELLHGPEAIREFFQTALQSGYTPQPRAKSFEATTDSVVVRGSIRVRRPDGSFAETKISWKYHFRDGLVDEVDWEPRAGD
jgi:ketosteroid isomerase-like protein